MEEWFWLFDQGNFTMFIVKKWFITSIYKNTIGGQILNKI